MRFEAPQTTISLDGNLDNWACGPIKAQTPFYPFNKVGVGPVPPGGAAGAEGSHCCGDELTMFDDRDNNVLTWNALDQSSAISFACKRSSAALARATDSLPPPIASAESRCWCEQGSQPHSTSASR